MKISSEKKVNMDLNRCYERYAECFRITFPSLPHRHIKNGLTIYQQPVQQELVVLPMNKAAFAGNKQSAQEQEETNENHGLKNKALF